MTRFVLLALVCPAWCSAADWPQWLGPTRDGTWQENGILEKFPQGGPKKLWEAPVMGGYAGPAVVAGCVYVHEYDRKAGNPVNDPSLKPALAGVERIRCLDAITGQEKWKHEYESAYAISYPCGPRCTPTVVGNRVYALGAMGHLCCLNAATGKPIWCKDFVKDFKAPVPTWGFAGHPLVTGDTLVCLVGGPSGGVVAFEAETGKTKWTTLLGAEAGYCPPSEWTIAGKPQLLVWHPKGLAGLTPSSGQTLWETKLEPMYGMSVAAPQVSGDHLFAGGMGGQAVLLKFDAGQTTPKELWRGDKDTAVYPTNSTPIIHEGIVYGCDSTTGGLRAVQLQTGKRLWERFEPTTGKESAKHGTAFLTRNGNRFFVLSETGALMIAKLSADGYQEIDRAKVIEPTGTAFGRRVAWSPPAFADRKLFVRNDKTLVCYDLSAPK